MVYKGAKHRRENFMLKKMSRRGWCPTGWMVDMFGHRFSATIERIRRLGLGDIETKRIAGTHNFFYRKRG